MIPLDLWQPLPVAQVMHLFANAPFEWCLAGGYAVEQFVGRALRSHDDIDIVVFHDDQLQVQRWLADWLLYAADPPGTLRLWAADEVLPDAIHDVWGHRSSSDTWQLQIMLAEVEGDKWVSRRHPLIRGHRSDLMTAYQDVPCIRIEVQLMYKAHSPRPKDEVDFQACLPLLDDKAKSWLRNALHLTHPEDHLWLHDLTSA